MPRPATVSVSSSAAGAALAGPLAGLGETGDATDVSTVLSYAGHARRVIRLAALHALARLAPDDATEAFLAALDDSSARVRRIACAALIARSAGFPLARLQAWATTANPGGRASALTILPYYPVAYQREFLLPFLIDPDDMVRGLSESLCLRSLAQELNPFLHPDHWQTWAEQHCLAWSAEHRQRVRELIRRRARGR